MSPMNSSPSQQKQDRKNREKYLLKVISPAIQEKTCPICLKELKDHRKVAVIRSCLHAYCLDCIRKWSDLKRKCPLCNAAYNSFFYKISFSSSDFLTEKLPDLANKGKTVDGEAEFSSALPQRMVTMRRSWALPRRRTFGRPGSVPCHVIVERKHQWRASVYRRGLKAVPISSRDCLHQNVLRDGSMKEQVLQRIKPWIVREMKAILEDPDPSVIVHVASSLFISSLEGKLDVHIVQHGGEDNDSLAPLRPFLQNWTNMFWHELRCFAETSLTMEAYDAVVAYVQSEEI